MARPRKAAPPPALSPQTICDDEARRFLYDHVGRYFIDGHSSSEPLIEGPCGICGKIIVGVDKSGAVTCRAVEAVTNRRPGALSNSAQLKKIRVSAAKAAPDDQPSGHKGGSFYFGEGAAVLISGSGPEADIHVITNVDPVRPLPDRMSVVKTGDGALGRLRRRVLTGELPLKTPYLYVEFGKRRNVTYQLGHTPSIAVIATNDGLVRYRLKSIQAYKQVIETVGLKIYEDISVLRARIALGEPSAHNDLVTRLAALRAKGISIDEDTLHSLPDRNDPNGQVALAMVRDDAAARAAGQPKSA